MIARALQAMDERVKRINPEWDICRFSQGGGREDLSNAILTDQKVVGSVQKVLAAGCEVQPAWAKKCLLLVPLTENEAVAVGLEFEKWHIVVHRDVAWHVAEVLRGFSRKNGARLRECQPAREARVEEGVKGFEEGEGEKGTSAEIKQTKAKAGGNSVSTKQLAESPERL